MGLTSILLGVEELLTISPQIIQLIMAIEQIFKQAGINQNAGPAKNALLMSIVAAAGVPSSMTNGISAVAHGTVDSFNASGIFSKSK